ncbi:class I SAM-dependent methyltransferase [Streptomyces sp. 8N616]|uniref:class I SAM-dependent methyltransferase n=1 Tax=Streptomyces sp. 8N616 TaxID=3457414 RepID=UPI003FCF919B
MTTEVGRLRALEGVWDQFTVACLEEIGVHPTWRCLEVGAGAGSIAHWPARTCAHGAVVATDLDTRFPSQEAPHLKILRHDVTEDDFTAGSFDLIHVRMVLCHVAEQAAVLARIRDWLTPVGILLAEDVDFHSVDSSPYPALRWARGVETPRRSLFHRM